MGATVLEVRDLVKRYVHDGGVVRAVDGVTFEIEEGSFMTLLGPSGCGKTTTLRCVAGLETPDEGRIAIRGATMATGHTQTVPAHKRKIGMVFQSYAIWPHMSVFENVAFPLRVERRISKEALQTRVMQALEMVELHTLARRMSTQLSGGQQQRLALARALVRHPELLLLDEPLSNLDAKLRDQMRSEVRKLQRELGIPALYVTHDQEEALSMSDKIAVMNHGRIVQEGAPRELYEAPADKFVANFVGKTNFIDGSVVSVSGPMVSTTTECGPMDARLDGRSLKPGDPIMLCVRPERISITRDKPQAANCIEGTMEEVVFLGEYLDCQVKVGSKLLMVRQHPSATYRVGAAVWLHVPPEACAILPEN